MVEVNSSTQKIPFWRDERFWRTALQLLAVIVVVIVFSLLINNLNRNLAQQGRQFDFGFLDNEAGFNIGESLVRYSPGDSYITALLVGLVNSLQVMIAGFILTTLVGVMAGVASFSENWLVRKLSVVYVEVVRNTPLLLQLFFWYFVVFFSLSAGNAVNQLPGSIFISKRGVVIPWPANTPTVWLGLVVLLVGAIAAVFLWRWRIKLMVERSASGNPQLILLIIMGIVALLILTIGLSWEFPRLAEPTQVTGGLRLSLEFSAILFGLVFYTGGFIAEIVRAGIQSVSKGQWEAARALGLRPGSVMQFVVFPQALRVIIPSLNSQYMNLAKNSSLALAVGYPDIYSVASTTFNQTGRPVEVFLIMMGAYLSINLLISMVMNQINQTVQIKER
jgi:general L-amino acid transport system permease protein